MFVFGKKKEASPNGTPIPAPVATPINPSTVIITMPEKFLVADKPPFWTAGKIWSVVILVVLLLLGGVFWLVSGIQPVNTVPGAPVNTAHLTNAPDTNTPPLPGENTPAPATNTPPINAPTPSDQPGAAETSTAVGPAPASPIANGPDTDGDGLTDAEETVYGTDPAQIDTDNDGFPDPNEIINGYNPKGAGKLDASGLFKTYSARGYQFSYPSAWSVVSDQSDVTVTASADEFFTITVEPNLAKQSLAEWYQTIAPSETAPAPETVGKWQGIFSANRRTFYTIPPERPDQVFVVSENIGTKTQINYPNIFERLIQTLALR